MKLAVLGAGAWGTAISIGSLCGWRAVAGHGEDHPQKVREEGANGDGSRISQTFLR